MEPEREIIRRERAILKEQYGELFSKVAALIFQLDPMGINYETNTDEYDPEVATILPRLETANSVHDVELIVHEEFGRWFGVEEADALEDLRLVAEKIWEVWCGFDRGLAKFPN